MKKLLLIPILVYTTLISCKDYNQENQNNDITENVSNFNLLEFEKERILKKVDTLINLKPITVTADVAARSKGGIHDFYSEGDYWWPDPKNPNGAYIRKDGRTNPDNFVAHRKAMVRFSQIAGSLASAYQITGDIRYVKALKPHVLAWFVNDATKMNPNLLFAQAIKGKVSGRGIGIIDTVHLVEVALAMEHVESSGVFTIVELEHIKNWFSQYNEWLTTHEFGRAEKENGNNHSVTYALQVAAYARLTENDSLLKEMRSFYKNTLLTDQMAADGSFPKETGRTKPYGYSIFNLDAMTALCQLLSTQQEDVFEHTIEEKNMELGMEYLYPYLKDKSSWPFAPDVMYWNDWPVAQPCLLFMYSHTKNKDYLKLWKQLDRDFDTREVVRNMPVKHYTLWYQNGRL
jgi:hypothetical protein